MILAREHKIVITPIGDLATELKDKIAREIERIFEYKTEVIPLIQERDLAVDAFRGQVHSTAVLATLSSLAPPQALKVLAVTRADLFIPVLTYVFGEAQLGGRACIISTHRLKDPPCPAAAEDAFHCRVVKEAVHELGHTFNLRHCPEQTCIMHYCRSLRDVDRKSSDLCRYCKVLLADEIRRLNARKAGDPD
ncbi:MAG: archaemetzincin family Zn-dependent metalloprotease [Thermodesulfobacteriota bacterium]